MDLSLAQMHALAAWTQLAKGSDDSKAEQAERNIIFDRDIDNMLHIIYIS